MRGIRYNAALLSLALLISGPRLAAQAQRHVFISLTAPNGTPVSDLSASDVTVSEDGIGCKIVQLEPANWPTKLQVLVDNGKPNTDPVNSLRTGLKGLFQLMPAGVEMSLYATAGVPHPIVKPTTDKEKLTEGVGLIMSDGGGGVFFDALSEAADRIEQDKTLNFPVIVMVASDVGEVNVSNEDFQKLQRFILAHAVTVHIIVTIGEPGAGTGDRAQAGIGLALTKLGQGRYESITATTRLATLLPELGTTIAQNVARQSHQYRVTYERPANPTERPRIAASVRRDGRLTVSADGRLP
jgi:hypothetical protein